MTLRIDVVFDVPATSPYHRQTVEAVRHAGTGANVDVEVNVVTTPEVNDRYLSSLPDGVVIGPGTPYEVPDGAETVVRTARERGLPLVGTWGGFQHVLVEHARSQAGIADATHAEYGEGGAPVVSLLECSINGVDITVTVTEGSRLASLHNNARSIVEHTTCNFGLNRRLEGIASMGGMRVAGVDELGEVRAVERPDHPFFVATLYQPQLRSSADQPHPVFSGLVEAAAQST